MDGAQKAGASDAVGAGVGRKVRREAVAEKKHPAFAHELELELDLLSYIRTTSLANFESEDAIEPSDTTRPQISGNRRTSPPN